MICLAEGKVKLHRQSYKLKDETGPHEVSSINTTLSKRQHHYHVSLSYSSRFSLYPVRGAGELDESFSPQTEITASHVPSSDEVLVCSPTLVLSGDKSQNSEAQSVAKPSAELLYEEIEVGSLAVSSTIFERLFEGDLPEGKGPDSCILTAGAKLVFVQSLASLRGDTQPTLLD
ncbi:hypothetical protein KY289_016970 [Solanum tuberosum]|nr:hypothetical protein KY284_016758 [Solanum tuberosum]KAH0689612.1 hypothetical protein KY289_016970 [Solanum tuberosum]